jgi:hypothetical protein
MWRGLECWTLRNVTDRFSKKLKRPWIEANRNCGIITLDNYTPMAYNLPCLLLRPRYSLNECWKP